MNSPAVDRDSHVLALIRSRQAAEADPDDIAAHFNQALSLCQLGQWEESIAIWKQVVQKEPDNAFAYVNMGIVHLEQAQWEQAEHAFTQAVRCRADHAPAHFGLGLARAQQEQPDAAKEAWEETLRLDPTHAEARYNLNFLAALPPESSRAERLPSEQEDGAQTDQPSPSLNTVSTTQVEYEVTSQINMLPVMQEADAAGAAKAPAENRIKLPPLSGPPLDAIAQSVISAQQDALNGQVAATTGQTQPVEEAEEQEAEEPEAEEQKAAPARVDPTLRLDEKELKKEYRKLRRQEASTKPNETDKRAMGKWAAGGAMILIVLLLIVWKAQAGDRQTASLPPSGSPAPSSVPITSASLSAAGQSPVPPPAASTTALSGQSNPVAAEEAHGATSAPIVEPDTASAPPNSSQSKEIPAVKPAKPADNPHPVSERATVTANDAPAPVIHAIHVNRQRADTNVKNNSVRASETRRKSQNTQSAHPAAATRHAAFQDEDTFPTHSHSGHTDNSEEWTDKIP